MEVTGVWLKINKYNKTLKKNKNIYNLQKIQFQIQSLQICEKQKDKYEPININVVQNFEHVQNKSFNLQN